MPNDPCMSASGSSKVVRCPVVAVGPLPPPVTGMTLVTAKVVERLRESGPVKILNMTPGPITTWLVFRAKRFLRTLACLGRLLLRGRAGNTRLYVTANSKEGLLTTLALVIAGRLLGYPVYLHHHTYFYIDRYDWRMALIDRAMGARGVHVVHCPQMAADFRSQYDTRLSFQYVVPSIFSLPLASQRQAAAVPMRLGHVGNLSLEKGLELVLQTLRELLKAGSQVRLRLAGPCFTAAAERLVNEALREFPDHIEYLGPVYGREKLDFFSAIDCFLFPSRSESWGIVLNEAMAAGVPVISSRHGCISTQVGEHAGLVIDDPKEFVPRAVKQIVHWIGDPETYRAASLAAVERADALDREGDLTLDRFVEHLRSAESEVSESPANV